MSEPLVSVIVAAYNAEKYLVNCVKSIQMQTYLNWELIICDDNSSDRTLAIALELAEKDNRIRVLHNETNLFAGETRNKCFSISKGAFLLIQDADDISEPDRIFLLMNAIETNSVDFVSSSFYLFDDNGRYKDCDMKKRMPTKKDFLSGMPFCHAATLFKREAIEKIGGYKNSKYTKRNEDYDMFMRLYAEGFKGCNIDQYLYGYRVDKGALSRRTFKFRLHECKVRFEGYKKLKILFPIGVFYTVKPVLAYFVQLVKSAIGKRS